MRLIKFTTNFPGISCPHFSNFQMKMCRVIFVASKGLELRKRYLSKVQTYQTESLINISSLGSKNHCPPMIHQTGTLTSCYNNSLSYEHQYLPGKTFAISAHLFPCLLWAFMSASSSSNVQASFFISGFKWLCHLKILKKKKI